MDHQINITIEDAKGLKEFSFHKRVKHFALYLVLSVIAGFGFSIYFAFELTKELGNIEAKKAFLKHRSPF